jgi:glycerol kinase
VGLTLKHTRSHVFRALIEAVAFGTEAVLEAMRAAGARWARGRVDCGLLAVSCARLPALPQGALGWRQEGDEVGVPLPTLASQGSSVNANTHIFNATSFPMPSPSPESLTVAGGATRSDLWLQIHADVSNLPLHLTE